MNIVLATGNPHKVEELSAIFAELGLRGVRLLSLSEAAPGRTLEEPKEIGTTFEENATIKAESYAAQTGMLCLADDSGIEIDALGGRPGVISSHYCTDGREVGMSRGERDGANNARVMREMEGVANRTARFVCVMALATPPTQARGTGLQPVTTRSTTTQPVVFEHLSVHTRNLPHWQFGGATYFVTFNLCTGELSDSEKSLVLDACKHWNGNKLDLLSCVVMPDHVHLILRPRMARDGYHPLPKLIHGIKRHSARTINLLRGCEGQLWQDEYFDRVIRADEWADTWNYVVRNPVAAGLVAEPEDYEFLYVNHELDGGLPADVVDAENRLIQSSKTVEESSHGLQTRATSLGSLIALVRGTFEGRIGLKDEVPRGENGFGYDPVFLVAPEFRFTGAEMPAAEKNKRSHRAMAAGLMAEHLRAQ